MLHCVHKAGHSGADCDTEGERHSEPKDRPFHIQASWCGVALLAPGAPVIAEEWYAQGQPHSTHVAGCVSHAARCVACHGVRSQPVPVAPAGEYSMPDT